jgi:hypothetical protein
MLAPALAAICVVATATAAEPAVGWRGNGTGLWPDAKPPLEWHRIPKGALEDMRVSAEPPKNADPGDAPLVVKGLIRDWLVIGPFPVADSVKDFDRDSLGGAATVEPSSGQKVGDFAWKSATVAPDDITVFGTAELPWLDLTKTVGYKRNHLAYAHTYLYSPKGGPVRIVADHAHGMKAWVNGKEVYRSSDRRVALGFYPSISKHELQHLDQPSARFTAELKPGWNRLLLKLSTSPQQGYTELKCCLRVMDPPDVKYDTKNIQWMTPLPARSTSTPIMTADRLFVLAEPDELLCLDKATGKILWSQAVNYYETITAEERRAQPAFAERVDPLVAKLKAEPDAIQRTKLRGEIQKALTAIDLARFRVGATDHFEAHFGIVGFTMPTPLCDGKLVYVWNGMGVAACFDLDGKRQWITRVKADELAYGSSPVLVDGVFVVFLNGLFGIDAKTGKLLWQQKRIRNNVASLMAATVAGKHVVVTQRGDLIDPANGDILFRPPGSAAAGDLGWAPPVILGDRMYLPRYGVTSLTVWDLAAAKPGKWEPDLLSTVQLPETVSRGPGGKWTDRWTAGSPLIHNGISYQIDIYQTLYAAEISTHKMLYREDTALDGFTHYNAVAVAASPTLVGKNILLCDNQGTTLVVQPGSTFKMLARNKIATVLDRHLPVPAQETLAYAPPLADGSRLYVRGEAFLYCIGER